MIFLKHYFAVLVIILSVLTVYTKDSDISVHRTNDVFKESASQSRQMDKSKSPYEFAPFDGPAKRYGFGGGGSGGGQGGDLFREFWHSLYVDRAYNSSFSLNIPLFTLTVPGYGRGLKYETPMSAINVGNLASIGILLFTSIALWMPIFFPEQVTTRSFNHDLASYPHILAKRLVNISEAFMGRSMSNEERQGLANFMTSRLVGVSESIMGWVEKSVDDLPNLPRLDAQECMKRCICEAHNQPKKYGLTGLVLQLFFPPYTEAEEPLKVVSKYQLAARYGRQDNANCAAQYDGCLVNFLDVVQGLINLVF